MDMAKPPPKRGPAKNVLVVAESTTTAAHNQLLRLEADGHALLTSAVLVFPVGKEVDAAVVAFL
jgi:hypothetical protein